MYVVLAIPDAAHCLYSIERDTWAGHPGQRFTSAIFRSL
jgi:hypothetical protein